MYLCSISNLQPLRRPGPLAWKIETTSNQSDPLESLDSSIPVRPSWIQDSAGRQHAFVHRRSLAVRFTALDTVILCIRVCQSPGCTDDGGSEALDYLTSLAPPGVRVSKGKCVSLCGAGPVVEVINDGSSLEVKEKKVTGDKLKEMVLGWHESCDGDVLKPYQITGLVQGYEESVQARRAYETKDYEGALELCTFAIQDARKPAMLLQEARDRDSSSGCESNDEELGFPGEMKWLVETFKVSCRCRMAL